MLISSTSKVLSASGQLGSSTSLDQEPLNVFLNFAGEIETLNALNSHAVDITNLMQGFLITENRSADLDLATRLGFRIKSIAQSLTLLSDTSERALLAKITTDLNKVVSSNGGYLVALDQIATSHRDFTSLKRQQIESVSDVDHDVEQIVFSAAAKFRTDIQNAERLTQSIVWIGVITATLVVVGIFWASRRLILIQIKRRFVTLAKDVQAIANGDYGHSVRVTGDDELGDIAHALNIFKKQAAELERSNSELERFAYVAAHDLRSPLDAIQDLAKWTLEDAGDELGHASRKNLNLLVKRSARLSALQSDLLTYAQVGAVSDGVSSLHLKAEIEKIADMVDPEKNYGIELINDPGVILCHSTPVRQILINLITNAIKHHDRDTGKISVLFSSDEHTLRFEVKDDGPGIELQFQDKIFELFKTLQSRDQVEGSGLGLALVTKLADRFGGRVHVKSDAPKTRGTTFIVELPDMSAHERVDKAA